MLGGRHVSWRSAPTILMACMMLVGVLNVGSAQASSAALNEGWTAEGGNPQHSGQSIYNVTGVESATLWTFKTADLNGPSAKGSFEGLYVAPDGTIYTQKRDLGNGTESGLVALNPNGTLKWFSDATAGLGNPGWTFTVGLDGTVYGVVNVAEQPAPDPVTGGYQTFTDYRIRAVNATDGSLKWEYGSPDSISSSMQLVVSPNGELVFIEYKGGEGALTALYPNGSLAWALPMPQLSGSLAIDTDSTIYVQSFDKRMYAVLPNGTVLWNVTVSSTGQLALDGEGNIYCLSGDFQSSALSKYDHSGVLAWTYSVADCYLGQPLIDGQGNTYFGFTSITRIPDTNGEVKETPGMMSLDSGGKVRWSVQHGRASMAMSADGIIYGVSASHFFAIGSDGRTIWQKDVLHSPYPTENWMFGGEAAVALGPNGTIYYASWMQTGSQGYVLAIRGTPSLDDPGLLFLWLVPVVVAALIAVLLVILYIVKRRGDDGEQ